ncbi:MAG TPA: hypothetical protein VF681_16045 [Abditibacteriaceae bacterium]|jgi:hypothetical protein
MRRINTLVLCFCLLLGLLQGCGRGSGNSDIDFAQNTMELLMKGNAAADDALDWESLQWMGESTTELYRVLPKTEKAGYRWAFISTAATQLRSMQASPETFSNWRVVSQDATQTMIMADISQEAKLRVTVTKRTGEPKVSAISIG